MARCLVCESQHCEPCWEGWMSRRSIQTCSDCFFLVTHEVPKPSIGSMQHRRSRSSSTGFCDCVNALVPSIRYQIDVRESVKRAEIIGVDGESFPEVFLSDFPIPVEQ